MDYLIKTHRPGTRYNTPHLFVLNRGRNSCKPLEVPCPNCWVIQAPSDEEITQLKHVLYCLHQSRQLDRYFSGSVIEFIRLHEFKKLLRLAVSLAKSNRQFSSIVKGLEAADQLELVCLAQLDKVKTLRMALGQKLMRGG